LGYRLITLLSRVVAVAVVHTETLGIPDQVAQVAIVQTHLQRIYQLLIL
jgi:hypothetical protein